MLARAIRGLEHGVPEAKIREELLRYGGDVEAASNQVNPAILSGGIWQTLLTTAVGLAVAIPVIALLNWLERRADRLAHEMDNLVTQLFTEDLSEDALQKKDAHHERPGLAATAAR